MRRHGLRSHPLYGVWNGMMNRCHNSNDVSWRKYGARGITVCKRWTRIENFILDMYPRPEGTSLERINNSKGYSKSNCKWATPIEQGNNTRRNVYLVLGKEKMTLAQWARKIGMSRNTLKKRWRMGWEPLKILTTPVSKSHQRVIHRRYQCN